MVISPSVIERASIHAALGDPIRLAIVDELTTSDRSPIELREILDVESNLLAHHLDTLEDVGLIERTRSSGDGRRRYVHLRRNRLHRRLAGPPIEVGRATFICTANSARSQLAAALWTDLTGADATSAGTQPAARVHPEAIAAGARAGLDLSGTEPRELGADEALPPLVVTVCDRAHEEVTTDDSWLHWSIPDPVPLGTPSAFDAAVGELRERIEHMVHPDRLAS